MGVADRAVDALERHRSVQRVRLVGSRAAGTQTAFSDWDFSVETDDFRAVARDIDSLLAGLRPLAQQWDPLSETWCRMVITRGPIKLDFIFAEPHEAAPPWQPRPDNLAAIDDHFWDWMLWLRSKQARGATVLVRDELDAMFVHILEPIGVECRPAALDEAVTGYVAAREALERRFGVSVPRTVEHEVMPALR